MATAAEVPVMRTELVDLLRLPTHANAILTLENLISAGDENVSASGVLCVHNLLWPSTNENLNFCGSFLYLNRVRSCSAYPSSLAQGGGLNRC
eukprot:8350015-Pyramimonas_sp.AAC.1